MTPTYRIHSRPALTALIAAALATPPLAASEIRSHPDAHGENRPSIHQSGNGTPVVDITTPGADGVSHNVYQQLDVNERGVVFNNGRTTSATNLAGQIGANPALAGGTADLILNEVRSASPSQLAGYLEIGGDPANLVVANPAGITCDGCGFINAERAMLTTGRPTFEDDRWTGLDVRDGRIRIEGDGLDASRTAEADLLARAVEINAGIWADRLDITTGTGQFDRAGQRANSAAPGTSPPEWGIDTAQLGGMYANKIRLVANEHGVGVRNAGTIAAGAAGLTITADGKLINAGTTASASNASMQGTSMINTGEVHAEHALALELEGTLDNRAGQIIGRGDSSIEAAGIDNRHGEILAEDKLTLTADGSLQNGAGLVYGARRLSVVTPSLTGEGRLLSAGELATTIDGDYLHQGEMAAGERLSLTVAGSLDNTGHLTSADESDISASAIRNRTDGEITAGQLDLAANGHLDNAGLIDGGDIHLVSATLDNQPVGRLYGGLLSVTADRLRNLGDDASAATIAARDALHLAVDNMENRDQALILSGGNMRIEGRAGTSADHLLNQGASIEALGDLFVAAKRIDNLNAGLVTAQVDEPPVQESWIQLRGSQRTFDTADCSSLYHENVWCSGYSHEISDFTWFQTTAVTSHTEVIESHPATLQAGGNMTIDGGTLVNADSQIIAGNALEARLDTLENRATQGQDITRREGTARFTTVESCGFTGSDHCREWHGTSPYRPAPEYGTPYDLPTVTYTELAGANPSAPTIPDAPGHSASSMPSLPNASLFRIRPDNPNTPLIETDPRFASYRHWYGSEAMLEALARDPAYTQKRLGDGFYEQSLVRQQIIEQTGGRYLAGFSDDEAQFRALIDAGATLGRDLSLSPGVRLSAEQLDQLTTDIVWLEEQNIDVAGETQRVLVPRLHLAEGPTQRAGSSGGIAAKNVTLAVGDTATNGGHLAATDSLTLSAERIENLGVTIEAGRTQLTAGTDFHQRGGEIRGYETLTLTAGRDVTVAADTRRGENRIGASHFSRDQVVDPGGLAVTGDGEMTISAGRDLTLQATEITHTGNGATRLAAGRDLQLQTTNVGQGEQITWDADNRLVQGSRRDVGTTIDTQGDIDLLAGRDVAIRAGEIDSRSGQVALTAENDIRLLAGRATSHWEEAHRIESGGLLSGKVSTRIDSTTTDRSNATSLGGERVNVAAGRDVTVTGSQVISDRGTRLEAGRDIALLADRDEQTRHHFDEKTRSGLFSNGGLSVTYGTQRLTREDEFGRTSTAPTHVASIDGDVELRAGDTFRQVGSDMLAPGGDINIQAGRVEIIEARDASSSQQRREMEQSGLTLALTSPVIETGTRLQELARATEDTDDSRMKRLAIASAGLAGFDTYNQVKTGFGMEDASAAERAGGVGINISVGASESRQTAEHQADMARGSRISANGDIRIRAAGQGDDSDILVRGSDIHAAANATLAADDEIDLLATESRRKESSQNDSQSASVGVGINFGGDSVGFSITASAARGEGETQAHELVHQLSRISAGKTASLQSGGDTSLVGAVVSGDAVKARVGGDLHIESVQDRMTYRSEQQNESVGVSIPITGASFAASYSSDKSEATGDYRSVIEQSAIHAGRGGFELTVDGNTDLVGSVITSDADPSHNQLMTGTLTTSGLKNTSSASAEASGISLSSDMMTQGRYGVAQGLLANTALDADRDRSSNGVSRSAIAEGDIVITADQVQTEHSGMTANQTIAALRRDTNSTHAATKPIDIEAMHEATKADRQIKTLASQLTITAVGDRVYASDAAKKKAVLEKTCDNSSGRCEEVILDFKDHDFSHDGSGNIYLFNHGIFNSKEEALRNAVKQHGEDVLETGIYTVMNPETDHALSEAVYASLDKIRAFTGWTWLFGASNSAHNNVDIREAVARHNERATKTGGQQLHIKEVGHSRGTLTSSIATRLQEAAGETHTPVSSVLFNGAAANAERMADRIRNVTDGKGEVMQNTHLNDYVGIIFGGNSTTGGIETLFGNAHRAYFKDIPPRRLSNGERNPAHQLFLETWGSSQPIDPIKVKPE